MGTVASRRETKAASRPTAAKIASAVAGHRRGCELFPFKGMQGKAQALIYHSCAATRDAKLLLRLGGLDAAGDHLASDLGRERGFSKWVGFVLNCDLDPMISIQ